MIFSSIDLKNTKTAIAGRKCKYRQGVKVGDSKCLNCTACHLVVPNGKTDTHSFKVKCMVATIQRNLEMWRAVQRLWAVRDNVEGDD